MLSLNPDLLAKLQPMLTETKTAPAEKNEPNDSSNNIFDGNSPSGLKPNETLNPPLPDIPQDLGPIEDLPEDEAPPPVGEDWLIEPDDEEVEELLNALKGLSKDEIIDIIDSFETDEEKEAMMEFLENNKIILEE